MYNQFPNNLNTNFKHYIITWGGKFVILFSMEFFIGMPSKKVIKKPLSINLSQVSADLNRLRSTREAINMVLPLIVSGRFIK